MKQLIVYIIICTCMMLNYCHNGIEQKSVIKKHKNENKIQETRNIFLKDKLSREDSTLKDVICSLRRDAFLNNGFESILHRDIQEIYRFCYILPDRYSDVFTVFITDDVVLNIDLYKNEKFYKEYIDTVVINQIREKINKINYWNLYNFQPWLPSHRGTTGGRKIILEHKENNNYNMIISDIPVSYNNNFPNEFFEIVELLEDLYK